MNACKETSVVFAVAPLLFAACSSSVAGSLPTVEVTDVVVATDTDSDALVPPRTTAWSVDFTETASLEGWSMGDCDGTTWPAFRVQHDMIWLGRACRVDGLAGPDVKLGTALYPPGVEFHGGWLVMDAIVDGDDTFGFHYGGTHFTYYRVTMALKDLNARFDVVALPPFGVDGTLQTGGIAALQPTSRNIGETLYVFPPYDTWFEFALHWDGRRHELYIDRVLVAEAELPDDLAVMQGGPIAFHQHNQIRMHVRSMAVHPPGPPPWESEGRP